MGSEETQRKSCVERNKYGMQPKDVIGKEISMKTKMKRICSLVLALAMCLSVSSVAFAIETYPNISNLVDEPVSLSVRAKMSSDIQQLDSFGLDQNQLVRIDTMDNTYGYIYDLGDNIISTVYVDEGSNGEVILTNIEGEKEDVVVITSDSKVFLNGLQVTTTYTSDNKRSTIATPRYTMYWKTETCPYGSASDYTDYQYTSNVFSVEFYQYIEDLTMAAIIEVLKTVLPLYGEIVDMLAQIVDHIADDDITPNTAASFREQYYYHATKGYYVSTSYGTKLGVARVVMEWFTSEFYAGTPRTFVYYDCGSLS